MLTVVLANSKRTAAISGRAAGRGRGPRVARRRHGRRGGTSPLGWRRQLLAALVALGCSLLAAPARAQCKTNSDCPAGEKCHDGKCVSPEAPPAGQPPAGQPPAGQPPTQQPPAQQPPAPPPSAPVDTVWLADGGRVRGQVMEEHPQRGVRVRLADGTVREIPASEVDHVEYAGEAPVPSVPPAPTPSPTSGPRPAPATRPGGEGGSPPTGRPQAPSGSNPTAGRPTTATRAAAAALSLSSGEPGRLSVDGKPIGPIGREPLDVAGLTPGPHEISVEFDAGDSTVMVLSVEAGEQLEATVEPPGARYAFAHREGLRFGVGAGGAYLYRPWRYADARPIEDVLGITEHGGGGFVEGVASYGLTPLVDLRLIPRFALASIPLSRTFTGNVTQSPDWIAYATEGSPQQNALALVPSALASVRLNLTSVYSLALGFRAGAEIYLVSDESAQGQGNGGQLEYTGLLAPRAHVLAHWGPELSLLSLRLGARRELEIDCSQGLLIDSMPSLQLGLAVRYLVLP